MDDPAEAVEQCSRALELQPGLHGAARLLASLMQRYSLNEEIDISPRGLRAAFQFIDVDRQALCNTAIAYLKFRPPLADIVAMGSAEGWDAAANYLLKGKGRKLLQDRLLAHPKISVIWASVLEEVAGEEIPLNVTGIRIRKHDNQAWPDDRKEKKDYFDRVA